MEWPSESQTIRSPQKVPQALVEEKKYSGWNVFATGEGKKPTPPKPKSIWSIFPGIDEEEDSKEKTPEESVSVEFVSATPSTPPAESIPNAQKDENLWSIFVSDESKAAPDAQVSQQEQMQPTSIVHEDSLVDDRTRIATKEIVQDAVEKTASHEVKTGKQAKSSWFSSIFADEEFVETTRSVEKVLSSFSVTAEQIPKLTPKDPISLVLEFLSDKDVEEGPSSSSVPKENLLSNILADDEHPNIGIELDVALEKLSNLLANKKWSWESIRTGGNFGIESLADGLSQLFPKDEEESQTSKPVLSILSSVFVETVELPASHDSEKKAEHVETGSRNPPKRSAKAVIEGDQQVSNAKTTNVRWSHSGIKRL
jgi:hypothetical protein